MTYASEDLDTRAIFSARSTRRRGPGSGRVRVIRVIRMVVVAVLLAATLLPLFWMLSTSFKTNVEATADPPTVIPRTPTLDNYAEMFAGGVDSVPYLFNSLQATIYSTVLVILISVPVAYAIGRHRFFANSGGILGILILSTRFIPPFMIILPLFLFYRDLRLLDTIISLTLTYTLVNLPVVVWILIPAARAIPNEIIEAATVDGASTFRSFFSVGIPMLRGAIATAATLSMIFAWNEFFAALVFTQTKAATMPILLATFTSSFGVEYGSIAANAVVAAIPVIVLGVLAQRHLVRGLTAGAVK